MEQILLIKLAFRSLFEVNRPKGTTSWLSPVDTNRDEKITEIYYLTSDSEPL